MTQHYEIRELQRTDADACETIVRELPDWFGHEEGIAEAREYLHSQEGVVATDADGEVLGWLTYACAFPESMEITWMAVAASAHRRGIGRALIDRLIEITESRETQVILVKTLADTHPSPEYAATRAFYGAMGFVPAMVLPELWDPSNPCLVMVRSDL